MVSKRIPRLLGVLAAIAALAFGGATFAAGASGPAKHGRVTHKQAKHQRGKARVRTSQTAEQPGESPEGSGESGSEVPNGDGPGGHADEPGNPNADHQFQGTE